MKKLYSSGRAMPTRTGSSEPTRSSHDTSYERMTTSLRSLLRVRFISLFYSYRRRAMVGSRTTSGSTLYGTLQRRGWLEIFSPKAIANRTQVYTRVAQQGICATRTPASNAALQNLEKIQVDAEPMVSSGLHELASRGFAFFFGVKK